jgi:hypothetical protein
MQACQCAAWDGHRVIIGCCVDNQRSRDGRWGHGRRRPGRTEARRAAGPPRGVRRPSGHGGVPAPLLTRVFGRPGSPADSALACPPAEHRHAELARAHRRRRLEALRCVKPVRIARLPNRSSLAVTGRRGRPAGDATGGMARPRRVRGATLDPDLALPNRDQPLPERPACQQPAPAYRPDACADL